MTLKQQIQQDMISSMKAKDETKVSALRMLKAAILKFETSGERKEATDDDVLVIIGKEANKLHRNYEKIGYRNWINFEIAKSIEAKNSLVAVKLSFTYESPEEIRGKQASWAMSFTEESIIRALREA